jgi:large subunit ribosomal protein L10
MAQHGSDGAQARPGPVNGVDLVLRKQKEQVVDALHETFANSSAVVVAHQKGLTVAQITDLRGRMREAGAGFRVTKNRLAKRALEGTSFEGIADLFSGPTTVAYSEDPVAAARVAVKFAADNDKFEVVGGALDGKVLSIDEVKALAALPSLDELRAKIVGMISTPATRIAAVTAAPAGQLARVFGAYGSSEEAA